MNRNEALAAQMKVNDRRSLVHISIGSPSTRRRGERPKQRTEQSEEKEIKKATRKEKHFLNRDLCGSASKRTQANDAKLCVNKNVNRPNDDAESTKRPGKLNQSRIRFVSQ